MGMNMNKKLVYSQFKSQFVESLAGTNYDANKIKAEFRNNITARRRYERISTLPELLEVLEKQLIIFPDRGVLEPYKVIALALDPPRYHLAALVDSTKVHLLPRQPAPLTRGDPHHRVPAHNPQVSPGSHNHPGPQGSYNHQAAHGAYIAVDIIQKIAKTLDDAGGRDWENLATGLGYKLKNADRDKVRIRQGEVDRIDRNYASMEQKLAAVFSTFINRCKENNVFPNLVEHVCDILKSKEVFGFPFNQLARQISEMHQ